MGFCDKFSGAVLIASQDGNVTYWSPAAAAEFGWSEVEACELGVQGLFSRADAAPDASHSAGMPLWGAGAQQVKAILKSGRAACFECQVVPLADAGGCMYGGLYMLRAAESGGKSNGNSSSAPEVKAGSSWGQALHKLNNVFASIHSSLDLVVSGRQRPEAESFLLQAQESARAGARIINELQLRGKELPGLAEPKCGDAKAKTAGDTEPLAEPPPAALEGSERLLLAEDETPMRALIRAVLTYRGYEVVEAVDGEDAVNKYLANGPFDLVIFDMDMPKLAGPEALQRIRAQNSSVRAMALSGALFDEEAGRNPAVQFNGHLNKPFRNIDLVKLVRRILDHPPAA